MLGQFVDHRRAPFEHRVGDRAVEHRQDLGDGGDRPVAVDRLPVSLAELAEEVPEGERRGELACPREELAFVAVGLHRLPARLPRALGILVALEGGVRRVEAGVFTGEIEVHRCREGFARGALVGPRVVGHEREDRIPQLLGRLPPQARRGK